MTTKYPSQIDTNSTLPRAVDLVTPVKAAIVNDLIEAIITIENELGVKPSATYATVRARLDTLEGILGNLQVIELDKDLGGTLEEPLVVGIQGRPVSSAAPIPGEVLVWNGIAWAPAPGPSAVITFGGDLSGSPALQTVIGIQGRPVASTAPTTGQALVWGGSSWAPGTISGGGGGAPTGPAGGDLDGYYPNPVVKQSTYPSFTVFGTELAFTGGQATEGFDLPATDAQRIGTTTTDNVAKVMNSVTPEDTQLIRVMSEVGATDGAGGAAWFLLKGVWVRSGSQLIAIKEPTVVDQSATLDALTWTAQLVANGSAIETQVSGENGKTIQWSLLREWLEVAGIGGGGGGGNSCPATPFSQPNSIAFDGTYLWVTDKDSPILTKIDPFAEAPIVVKTFDLSQYGRVSLQVRDATFESPIKITVAGAHGLTTGDQVNVSAVSGNTAANGTWFITVVDTTSFTLDSSTGNGFYTSGGKVLAGPITNARHVTMSPNNGIIVSCMDSGLVAFIDPLTDTVYQVSSVNNPGETGKVQWAYGHTTGEVFAIKTGATGGFSSSIKPLFSGQPEYPAPAYGFISQCHLETLTYGAGYLWASGGAQNGQPASPIFRLDIDVFSPNVGTWTTHVNNQNANIWGVHFAFGSVWASTYGRKVFRYDPATFPSDPIVIDLGNPANGTSEMWNDGTYLWVTDINFHGQSFLYKIDPNTNTSTGPFFTVSSGGTGGITYDGANIWACARNGAYPSVFKVDTTVGSEEVLTYYPPPFKEPVSLTYDGAHLWASDTGIGSIFKIVTDENVQPCPGCSRVINLSSYGLSKIREIRSHNGIIYACGHDSNKIVLVDATTEQVVGICTLGQRVRSVTFDNSGNYWVATFDSGTLNFSNIYKISIAATLAAFPGEPTPLLNVPLSHHTENITFGGGFLWMGSGGFQNFWSVEEQDLGTTASLTTIDGNTATLSGITGADPGWVGGRVRVLLTNCAVANNNAEFTISQYINSSTVVLFNTNSISPVTDGNNGSIVARLSRFNAEPLMRLDPNNIRTGTGASIVVSGLNNQVVTISGLSGMTNADVGLTISIRNATGTFFGGFNNNTFFKIRSVTNATTVVTSLGSHNSGKYPTYNGGGWQPVTDANNGNLDWTIITSHNAYDPDNGYVFEAYYDDLTGSVWAGNGFHGVQRWDPNNFHPLPNTFPLPTNPITILSPTNINAFQGQVTNDGQYVWTTGGYSGGHSVVRVDPATNQIIAELLTPVPAWSDGVAYDGKYIWFTTRDGSEKGALNRVSITPGSETINFRLKAKD